MSDDLDIELLKQKYLADMAEHARLELEKSAELINQFRKIVTSKGIIFDSITFDYVQTIGILATAPGLARKLLNISPSERDGLFAFDEIVQMFPSNDSQEGYFIGKDCMLMAHPCFRRRMQPMANWAPRFVAQFWQLDLPNCKKFIAIDEDRVRINVDDSSYMELDTWYGAPFDEDITKIENGIVKLRPPLDLKPHHIDMFFASTYCLDIKWSEAYRIKSFQALEIKTEETQLTIENEIYYPARYLHAEFDIDAGIFRHFDGAIQLFTEDEYFRRRDLDFNITFKDQEHIKARSIKVFKLNGEITVDLWVELCCQFFTANPLTFEYFAGVYPAHIAEIVDTVRKRVLSN
ncbi:MAG: hypothetical protein CK426_08985 [Legionella sp.]|nr:MAG: hypothetical protein CK426_08985 [Legionella sp.]